MKITLRLDGGFAAVPAFSRSIVVDTAELSPEIAADMHHLVADAELGQRPRRVSGPAGAADLLTYRLTVEGEGQTDVLEFTDPIPDAALNALVARLQEIARGH